MRRLREEPLIVDLFAGGGGASTGIEAALGRSVDIAINHSPTALAVHAANHPGTRHFTADVFEVDPVEATGGRPVDLLWASPDCTHFSVAKGGKPRSQKIRSLADVVPIWAEKVRPRLICLENVSEFQGWGPLDDEGKPVKARAGEFFREWKAKLEALGYRVEHRVLDASLFGAPTKRRRLFLVARCDRQPIRWPDATHGPGRLPVHTAAECIDWSLPCPSIFERKKPLAEKTLWRIAQGIRRFVLENPTPFVLTIDQQGTKNTAAAIDQPITTVVTKARHAVVVPHVTKFQENSTGQDPREPLDTVMAGATRFGLVAPNLVKVNHGGRDPRGEQIDLPLSTITASRRGHALVAPTMVQTSYGERPGQRPRYLDLHQPLGTVVAQGQKHALVSAFLAKHFGGPRPGRPGSQMDEPTSAITAVDHHSLAAVALAKFRGTDPSQPGSGSVEEPLPTISAGGIHVAEVRAFLTAYYGEDATGGQLVTEPLRTITAKARLGLVTVAGTEYQIVDIGMRMLEPRELLRAQFGRFAETYDLSAATTKAAQVRLIGNSVCPEVAEAIVAANAPRESQRRAA